MAGETRSIAPLLLESKPAPFQLAPGPLAKRLLVFFLRPGEARPGILMVTRPDLFPPNHGAAVKIERTAWALSRLMGSVYLVTDDRWTYHHYANGERHTMRYPRLLAWIGPWPRVIRHRLRRAGVPVGDVFLYTALRDWNLSLRAAYVASRHGIRVFQAEFPAYARVCLWVRSLLGGHTMLVEHNVEFERLREQVSDLSPQAHGFLRQVEIDLCNLVDCVVAVSNRDRDTLIRHGVDGNRVHVIPHGVDIGAFDAAVPRPDLLRRYGVEAGRPVLVYHGIYLYPPNLEAIRILAQEILPRVFAHGLHPVVLAIGPNPPAETISPDVLFLGGVESVAPFIKAADIAVVPLLQGGGTRMKVLDYFAASIPVVSTSKGVEGLGLVDGEQVLIRDGYDDFAQAVATLIRDKDQARGLGARGRAYVERFDWLNIARRYLKLYGNAAASEGTDADEPGVPDQEE